MTKKFIVVAHPRSGSTFLVERIVATVNAHAPHVDHQELFNSYERLFNACALGLDGSDEIATVDGFFASSQSSIALFKTIPSFHFQWNEIASRTDIHFITVQRHDILSTVASILICEHHNEWKRPAREHAADARYLFRDWFKSRRQQEMLLGSIFNRLLFDLRALEVLNGTAGTLVVDSDHFSNASHDLAATFGQPISFNGYKRLSHFSECFVDADIFRETVLGYLSNIVRKHSSIPRVVEQLLSDS
ncbi:MAG: hypothetical protein R3C05_08475 [Pirellulaceae bacterium]